MKEKIPATLLKKIENKSFSLLTPQDFQDIKALYLEEAPLFIALMKKATLNIRQPQKALNFSYFAKELLPELSDIAPFLAVELYGILKLLIQSIYVKQVIELLPIFEQIADVREVELFQSLLKIRDVEKVLSGVELYQVKKLIYEANGSKNANGEILFDFAPMELSWAEDVAL